MTKPTLEFLTSDFDSVTASREMTRSGADTLTQPIPPATDRELLTLWIERKDSPSLEILIRRHAPLVASLARKLLRSPHEQADAFQSVFLLLSQQAIKIRQRESLASWIYGVTVRTCLMIARARRSHVSLSETHNAPPHPDLAGIEYQELASTLDEELQRLPAHLRETLILVYMEGHSRQAAADLVNTTEQTIKSRLARARNLLRSRLLKRGLTFSTAFTTFALTSSTSNAAQSLCTDELISQTLSTCQTGHLPLPPTSPPLDVTTILATGAPTMSSTTFYTTLAVTTLLLLTTLGMATRGHAENGSREEKMSFTLEKSVAESARSDEGSVQASFTLSQSDLAQNDPEKQTVPDSVTPAVPPEAKWESEPVEFRVVSPEQRQHFREKLPILQIELELLEAELSSHLEKRDVLQSEVESFEAFQADLQREHPDGIPAGSASEKLLKNRKMKAEQNAVERDRESAFIRNLMFKRNNLIDIANKLPPTLQHLYLAEATHRYQLESKLADFQQHLKRPDSLQELLSLKSEILKLTDEHAKAKAALDAAQFPPHDESEVSEKSSYGLQPTKKDGGSISQVETESVEQKNVEQLQSQIKLQEAKIEKMKEEILQYRQMNLTPPATPDPFQLAPNAPSPNPNTFDSEALRIVDSLQTGQEKNAPIGTQYKNLLALLAKEQELLADFGPQHPEVQKIRDQIRLLKQFIAENGDNPEPQSESLKPDDVQKPLSKPLPNSKTLQSPATEESSEKILVQFQSDTGIVLHFPLVQELGRFNIQRVITKSEKKARPVQMQVSRSYPIKLQPLDEYDDALSSVQPLYAAFELQNFDKAKIELHQREPLAISIEPDDLTALETHDEVLRVYYIPSSAKEPYMARIESFVGQYKLTKEGKRTGFDPLAEAKKHGTVIAGLLVSKLAAQSWYGGLPEEDLTMIRQLEESRLRAVRDSDFLRKQLNKLQKKISSEQDKDSAQTETSNSSVTEKALAEEEISTDNPVENQQQSTLKIKLSSEVPLSITYKDPKLPERTETTVAFQKSLRTHELGEFPIGHHELKFQASSTLTRETFEYPVILDFIGSDLTPIIPTPISIPLSERDYELLLQSKFEVYIYAKEYTAKKQIGPDGELVDEKKGWMFLTFPRGRFDNAKLSEEEFREAAIAKGPIVATLRSVGLGVSE